MSTDKTTDLAAKTVEDSYAEWYCKTGYSTAHIDRGSGSFFEMSANHIRKLLRECYYDPPKGSSVSAAAQVVVDNKMAGMVFNDVVVRRLDDHDQSANLVIRYNLALEQRSRSQPPPAQPVAAGLTKAEVRQAAGADLTDGAPVKEQPSEVRPGVVVRLKSGGPKMTARQVYDTGIVTCGYFVINGHDRKDNPVYGTYCEMNAHKDALEVVTEEETA